MLFKEIEKLLNNNKLINDLKTDETDVGYFANFSIYKKLGFSYNMRKGGDISIIRAEVFVKAGEDLDINVIANNIIKNDENIRYTVYDEGKIVFQKVTPYEDNDDVLNYLKNSLKEFINAFVDNAEMLDCDLEEDVPENKNVVDPEFKTIEDTKDETKSNDLGNKKRDKDVIDDNTHPAEAGAIAPAADINDKDNKKKKFEKEKEEDKEIASTSDTELDALLAALDDDAESLIEEESEIEDDIDEYNEYMSEEEEEQEPDDKSGDTEDIVEADIDGRHSNDEFDVTSQLDKMYKDMESIFDEREKALQIRNQKLDKVSQKLKEKEEHLKSVEDDLNRQRDNIRSEIEAEFNSEREQLDEEHKLLKDAQNKLLLEEKNIELNRRKVQVELETIEIKKKALEDKFDIAEDIKEDNKVNQADNDVLLAIEELKKKNAEYKSKQASLDATVNKQKAVIDKFKAKREDWESEKKSLQKDIDLLNIKLEQEMKKKKVTTKTVVEDDKKSKEKIRELEEQLKAASDTKNNIEKDKAKLEKDVEELRKKLDEAVLKKEPERDLKAEAKEVIETCKATGINLEVVPGEGQMVLMGEHENSTICVNVEAGMIYVEKKIKKPSKYSDLVEKWNVEDICFAYFYNKDKVICKCKYDVAAKTLMEVVSKFRQLI